MPLSHFRRPAVLAALALVCWLALRPSPASPLVSPNPFASLTARVVSPLKEDRRGEKVLVDAPAGRLLVFLPEGAGPPLRPGRTVELSGRLRRPRSPRNPGEFDERAFLAQRGAGGVLHAERVVLSTAPVPWGWLPWSWAEGARRSFEASLERGLPEPQAGVAVGLALGYKGPLPSGLNRAVQDAGVMHLLVPSGAKVAFVTLAVLWLGLRLRLRPPARAAWAAAAGGFYTLMVGGDAPYARAFLGGAVLLAAPLMGRDPGPLQAIALSALAILLYEPLELRSVGFQMTYAAVLGLALGLPRLRAALPRRWPRWAREAALMAGLGAIVQAMLWPLFAQVFGKGSLVGPLANVLLVPYSSVLMALAFLVWLGAPAWPLRLGVDAFIAACRLFAGWPGAAVPLSPMSGAAVAAYYLAAGAVLVWPERRARWALLLAAALVAPGAGLLRRAERPGLRLLILSPSRGRDPTPPAALLSFGDRHWLAEPSGPPGPILSALKARGVRRLEAVVVSAPGEVPRRLLEELEVERVLRPRRPWRSCLGPACARFERGRAPAVTRVLPGDPEREWEYCIIALRLKSSAVDVFFDGAPVRIEAAR